MISLLLMMNMMILLNNIPINLRKTFISANKSQRLTLTNLDLQEDLVFVIKARIVVATEIVSSAYQGAIALKLNLMMRMREKEEII